MPPVDPLHPHVDAVFFDFGGVFTTSPFEAFEAYERRRGIPVGTIRRLNSTNPDANAWARLERNEIDVDRFVELFEHEAVEVGVEVEGTEVLACLSGQVRPEMVAALRLVSSRFVTALLTNNMVTATTGEIGGTDPLLAEAISLFDVVIESSAVGVRKPEPRFYELACGEARVDPSRVVFLDDLGVNLKPARSMGMRTIKVTDPRSALVELGTILGVDLVT